METRLINKVEKETATFASQDPEKSPQVQKIRVTKTHTEATDGYIYVKVTPHDIPDPADFPNICDQSESFDSLLLDAESLKKIKMLKENKRRPILNNLAIARNNGNLLLGQTDLSQQTRNVMQYESGEDWIDPSRFFPQTKETKTVALSVALLEKLIKICKKNKGDGISLTIFQDDVQKVKQVDGTLKEYRYPQGLVFESKGPDNTITGLIMPQRINT